MDKAVEGSVEEMVGYVQENRKKISVEVLTQELIREVVKDTCR